MKKLLLSLLATLALSNCMASDPLLDEMIHDLSVAKYNFANKYAPKQWKKEKFGWSLDNSFLQAKNRVLNEKPQKIADYQKIFKEFILSTNDYHVNVEFYSTARFWYPLFIKRIDDRYYVASIEGRQPIDFMFFNHEPIADFDHYLDGMTNIEVGDEIVEFNGHPVKEQIEKIIDEELAGNRTPTGYSIAERKVFNRTGCIGDTFEVAIIHQGAVKPVAYTLPWLQIKEKISDQPLKIESLTPNQLAGRGKSSQSLAQLLNADFCVRSVIPLLRMEEEKEEANGEEEEEETEDIRIKGNLPPLGEIIWESKIDQHLYAYLYLNNEGKKIGYIYLQSFSNFFYDEMVEAIKHMQEESEGLVFDITNNPGGNVLFAYSLLSLLTDKPLVCPKQVETLIQQDLFVYALVSDILDEMMESEEESEQMIGGLVFTKKMMIECKEYTKALFKTWESGKRISDPVHVFGISEIPPHEKTHYTKPILVLMNELDFSCGDLFPAILQDNKRATLFGKKTAGAGGYVKGYQNTSRFGIAYYSITGSLVYRSNGQVIENLGVTPEIPYEITLEDIRGNYAPYIKRVNQEIGLMLKG